MKPIEMPEPTPGMRRGVVASLAEVEGWPPAPGQRGLFVNGRRVDRQPPRDDGSVGPFRSDGSPIGRQTYHHADPPAELDVAAVLRSAVAEALEPDWGSEIRRAVAGL